MFSIPFELDRSIVVNKPISEVFQALGDFNNWAIWSPWIIQEPSCPVTSSGEPCSIGHQQEWNGERIGSGRIELIDTTENKRLAHDLFFISPWKSHSKTQFELEAITDDSGNEATKITWLMQGTLPFFLFFMKKMMSVFVGGDYERGLKMFKQYIETGSVDSAVEIHPAEQQDGFYYVGFQSSCNVSEISEVFGPLFQKLMKSDIPQPDTVLTVVNNFDFVNKKTNMIAAVGYKTKPDFEFPAEMVSGEMPSHKAQSVTHTGSYNHLANGWATIMNYLRFAKLKQNKKLKEYEVYLNDPAETPESELKTKIYIPIK